MPIRQSYYLHRTPCKGKVQPAVLKLLVSNSKESYLPSFIVSTQWQPFRRQNTSSLTCLDAKATRFHSRRNPVLASCSMQHRINRIPGWEGPQGSSCSPFPGKHDLGVPVHVLGKGFSWDSYHLYSNASSRFLNLKIQLRTQYINSGGEVCVGGMFMWDYFLFNICW